MNDRARAQDDAVTAIVATRRLVKGGGPRHSFTVEHTEARLRLRDRPGRRPWDWSLVLVRGLLALVDTAEVEGTSRSADGLEVLELRIRVEAAALDGFDPGLLFDVALEPDPGPGDGSPAHRRLRLRRLCARALNECLAESPVRAELVTPAGTRVLARSERASGDPYAESSSPARCEPGTLIVRVAYERGFTRWVEGVLAGGERLFGVMMAAWLARVPSLERRKGGATLRAVPAGHFIPLGRHARLWPALERGPLQLLRDGVAILRLDAVLAEAGIAVLELAGHVECPRLRLTVDESNVVRDEALALLLAWLRDALDRGSGEPLQLVEWPARLDTVTTASGATIDVASLAASDRELPYVLREQATELPLSARAHVLALSPSELELLQRQHPQLLLVAANAIAGVRRGDPFDVGALAQGSFPPFALVIPAWAPGGAEAPALDVACYVHRHGVATRGAVMLVARDRLLAKGGELDRGLAGVTLVARLSVADATAIAEPQRQQELLQWLAGQALARRDDLLAQAVAMHVDIDADVRTPMLRAAIDGLDARALELRYELSASGACLVWREHPLLVVAVARTRDGAPRTLGAALVRARDTGGIVIGEAARRWHVLEDEDPAHETWVPSARGHELLERVLGRGTLWELPTVAQSHAHVAAAAQQRALVLDRDEVARLLGRSGDVRAREALLAHLLVARGTGGDELGLRDVPLLTGFDPEAVQPSRLVSLAAMLSDERVHAVVPNGTATRELPGPVVEASPGLASLLHEVARVPVQPVAAQRRRSAAAGGATRTNATRASVEPVLRHPIADALGAGALQLLPGAERRGVDLWARGLRIGELELPSPLSDVGGRLWLTDAGVRAGRPAIETMLLKHARALVMSARRQAELAPPGGARRRVLERFVAHCQATATAGDDRLGLASAFATARGSAVLAASAATAARLPPLRRLWLGALVRHALGHAAKVETAWLSWKLAELEDATKPVWQLELGGRHRWINRAERDESTTLDVQLTALAVAAEVLGAAGAPSVAVCAAMLRVIATAHVGPRT